MVAFALIFQALVHGQGFPYGAPSLPLDPRIGVPPSIPPINPNVYPFGPAAPPFPVPGIPAIPGIPRVPGVPPGATPPLGGVRNPYYNNYNTPVGPAVPILTYSSNGPNIDGTYEFRYI